MIPAASLSTLFTDLAEGPELPNDVQEARRNGTVSNAAVLIQRRFPMQFKSSLSRLIRGL
jgi:hypothetical protein